MLSVRIPSAFQLTSTVCKTRLDGLHNLRNFPELVTGNHITAAWALQQRMPTQYRRHVESVTPVVHRQSISSRWIRNLQVHNMRVVVLHVDCPELRKGDITHIWV